MASKIFIQTLIIKHIRGEGIDVSGLYNNRKDTNLKPATKNQIGGVKIGNGIELLRTAQFRCPK